MNRLLTTCEKTTVFPLLYGPVNFSYPSLEEPKPQIALQPEPEPEHQAPPAPPQVNGVAATEQPSLETVKRTDSLPDMVDSPTASPANSQPDPSVKVSANGTPSSSVITAKVSRAA